MRKLFYALALFAVVGCSDGGDSGNAGNNNNTNNDNTGTGGNTSTEEFVPSFTPRYAGDGEIKVMSFNVRLMTTEDNLYERVALS